MNVSSPLKYAAPSTLINETKGVMDVLLKRELEDTIFQAKYDSFVRAYLSPSPPSITARYRRVERVIRRRSLLRTSPQMSQELQAIAQRGNSPANDDNLGFYPLKLVLGNSDGDAKSERAMYDPLVELVSFIRQFYRDHDLSGDESWSRPRNPDPTAKPSAPDVTDSRPLERDFVNCYNTKLRFGNDMISPPDLKLDIALLLRG
ncbi:hypothetical protein FRB94_012225 [Tulasnella sp. JGI-2019a]|nr:hypothetical protein FRB94_012225 [Tulasnella sp. JGI-2019a]